MTDAARDALRALQELRAVTTEPPAADVESDEIIARGAEVVAAREQPLCDLAAALAREPGSLRGLPEAVELYDIIQQRVAGWHAVLAHARHVVGERLQAVSRARAATYR